MLRHDALSDLLQLLLRLHDGRLVETVGIPGDSHGKEEAPADGTKRTPKGHLTACISSQVCRNVRDALLYCSSKIAADVC
jgi:adenine C2-methylase RlmN of 23S rRNA A2503 and tRNA A37